MITKEQRDADIHTLSVVNSKLSIDPGLLFILTGSYAIEALTQTPIDHKDMDGNVVATSLASAIVRTAVLMENLETTQGNPNLFKRTADRLEYDIGLRRLEFQFVEEKAFKVPIVLIQLRDSNREAFKFRVKSLLYTIATWAIRISGAAHDQKRPVKDTDLDNFALLLASGYECDDVISTMRRHPQMPKNISERIVLERALAMIGSRLN